MKNTYSQIWNYLEGKLSTEQEEELMDWIGESERNTEFFNQVIHDFNEINIPPAARNTNWYWAAASVLLIISLSIWVFHSFNSKTPTPAQDFMLSDGSEVTISKNTKFVYDSLSFESTKWIKIQGTAEISTQMEEHLLIETQNGFLMLEGNSSIQMKELPNNEMKVFVEKGNIRWLNPSVTSEELAITSGEKMLFKNDGKTVLFNHARRTHKPFLIFENYMNL